MIPDLNEVPFKGASRLTRFGYGHGWMVCTDLFANNLQTERAKVVVDSSF
jgi:hypothetical protein